MATVLSPTDQRVIMTGVSWQTYERLLADFSDSHAARMAFDQGTLEIMAPSFAHERPLHLIVQIIEIITEVRDMDMVSAGSTTFKREDLGRGFEPDASFYIQHAGDVRSHAAIDVAQRSPSRPRDRDRYHPSRLSISSPSMQRLGSPKSGDMPNRGARSIGISADGYAVEDSSTVLPGVTSHQLTELVAMGYELPRPTWLRHVRAWAEGSPAEPGRANQATY